MRSRPWTAADAVSHNAALKGKAKMAKLWADTANGTLQSELEKKTPQDKAEGIAIATANKAVSAKLRTVTVKAPVIRDDNSRSSGEDIRVRTAAITPASLDEERRTVRATLGTDAPCISICVRTGRPVLEVYLMDGMEPVDQVPLCDTHKRDSIDRVKGSVREIEAKAGQFEGVLCIDETEQQAWSKVKNRHVTDVSAGFQPIATQVIKAGETATVNGRKFTAPADRDLEVHAKWRLREVSLTPIGSDKRAKIRTLTEDQDMKASLRKWLEENFPEHVRTESSEEEAQAFWDTLSAADRTRAEEAVRKEDDEDEDDEDEDDEEEDDEDAGKKAGKKRAKARSAACRSDKKRSAEDEARIRDEGREEERNRVARIRKLGEGLDAEIVQRAIDEDWSTGRAKTRFLSILRDARARSVGGGGNVSEEQEHAFGIHVRGKEKDCTVETLAASLLTRSWHGSADPCDILGGYQPSGTVKEKWDDGKERTGLALKVRGDVTRMIEGHAKQASADRRKVNERLLEQGDRYRGMCMMDIVDEVNRIEGRERTSYDPEERVRAAMSGSALAAIFTQNVSAMFLGGYIDAADSTVGWVQESDVPNFLSNERAIYGKMGQLERLGKGGTAADLDTSDWNETFKISRYAGKFVVDEQDFYNDRFGALEQMSPQDMGLSARQIRPNLVYATLLQNPTLNQDNTALFASGHNNIVTGALTDFGATTPTANAGPIQDATSLMGKQRLRGRVLNLQPRFIIAGIDLSRALNFLYAPANTAQKVVVSSAGYSYNPTVPELDAINLKYDSRLDPLGVYNNYDKKTYYPWTNTGATSGRSLTAILAARPGEQGAKTIEVGYLRGLGRAPRIRSAILREGSGQYGIAWDVSMDVGICPLDYRGLVLINGGGTQLAATGPAQS
jgi:hypothetical protein